MNNNLFGLNAEVTYKFLKNRAKLILSARDLLNKEPITTPSSPPPHTESGKSILHH